MTKMLAVDDEEKIRDLLPIRLSRKEHHLFMANHGLVPGRRE
jgi:DNA-binding NtrC family response regulator